MSDIEEARKRREISKAINAAVALVADMGIAIPGEDFDEIVAKDREMERRHREQNGDTSKHPT